MFDNLKTIGYYWAGQVKDLTLRKWYWPFQFALLLLYVIIFYAGFISLNAYQDAIQSIGLDNSQFIALTVTVIIALFVSYLIQSVAGTILDYAHQRDHKTKGHEIMFVAAILTLVGLLVLDVRMNLKGVETISKATTEDIRKDNSVDLSLKYQEKIDRLEDRITAINACEVKGYCYKGYTTREGKQEIANIRNQIDSYQTTLQSLIQSEQRATNIDKIRYDQEVQHKENYHYWFVIFAYIIAFVIAVFTGHITDKVYDHVRGDLSHTGNIDQEGAMYADTSNIGYATASKRGELDLILTKLESLERDNRRLKENLQNLTDYGGKGEKSPEKSAIPKGKRFSPEYQPKKEVGTKNKFATRADATESKRAIISAYRSIHSTTGRKPRYKEISQATGLSVKTVGNYIRAFKAEGVI